MTDPGVSDFEETVSSITSSLLSRAVTNDEQAWSRVVELYGPLVYKWCRQKQLGEEDARDAAQEVFRAVFRQLGNFRRQGPEDTFLGWLRTVTINKVHDHWRRKGKQPQAVGGSTHRAHLQSITPDPDPVDLSDDLQRLFLRILEFIKSEFSDTHWQVFQRVVLEGAAASDVAAEMGMERQNVYTIKSRILRRLREEFRLES